MDYESACIEAGCETPSDQSDREHLAELREEKSDMQVELWWEERHAATRYVTFAEACALADEFNQTIGTFSHPDQYPVFYCVEHWGLGELYPTIGVTDETQDKVTGFTCDNEEIWEAQATPDLDQREFTQ